MSRFVDIECTAVTEVIGRRKFESREDIQEFLDNIPTADVVEVRHGKWEAKEHTSISTNRHYYTFRCSECKKWNGTHRQNYCPSCGAKMDGGKNDL